jgi:hypothetical protein
LKSIKVILTPISFALKLLWGIGVLGLFVCNSYCQENARASPRPSYNAFKTGEKLKYNIHYGPVNAGKAIFTVKDEIKQINREPHYAIKVFGRSLSGWDWFYKVRDYYRSWVDTETLLPSKASRDVREGGYEVEERLLFLRKTNQVKRNGELKDVPARIHDIVSAIYYARCINFTKVDSGTYIPIKTFFANEVFPLGVTYKGTQTLETDLGSFRVRVFKPELIEGRVFKGQDDMTVYVSADKNQVPIRIESKIFVGQIQADLYAYQNLKYSFTAKSD